MKDPIDMSRDELRQELADSSKAELVDPFRQAEVTAELNLREKGEVPEPGASPGAVHPVLFAVHNGLVNLTDETGQFIERSYVIPADILGQVYELLSPYQIGEDTFIDIPMGGRPDGV